MDVPDYLFSALLVLSVVRQIRGKQVTWFQLAWPIGLVLWACAEYVTGFPASTPDVVLVCACALVGATLGIAAGCCTRVSSNADGRVIARATAATVVLWTIGTVARLLFGLYAEHGGERDVVAFSAAHGLSVRVWAPALTLMALAEVLGRTAALAPRAFAHRRRAAVSA